jgi:hypothetical protein
VPRRRQGRRTGTGSPIAAGILHANLIYVGGRHGLRHAAARNRPEWLRYPAAVLQERC